MPVLTDPSDENLATFIRSLKSTERHVGFEFLRFVQETREHTADAHRVLLMMAGYSRHWLDDDVRYVLRMLWREKPPGYGPYIKRIQQEVEAIEKKESLPSIDPLGRN